MRKDERAAIAGAVEKWRWARRVEYAARDENVASEGGSAAAGWSAVEIAGPVRSEWPSGPRRTGALFGYSTALDVAIAVCHHATLTRSTTVRLPNGLLREFEVDRHAARRALNTLEAAGLVRVERAPGRTPVVTVVENDAAT